MKLQAVGRKKSTLTAGPEVTLQLQVEHKALDERTRCSRDTTWEAVS